MTVLIGTRAAVPTRAQQPVASTPTFTRDVAPILFKQCVSCHRPGEIAPMSLMTYEQARPWAKSILKVISNGTMPPWHADAPAGTFHNERVLTDAERKTLMAWAAERRAERRRERSAARADVRRGMGSGQTRRRSRDAGGLSRSRVGHRGVRILLRADELYRVEVGEVDRSEARQSRAGAPRPCRTTGASPKLPAFSWPGPMRRTCRRQSRDMPASGRSGPT